MTGQPHLTHRDAYLRGQRQGQSDAAADRDYRPRDGATGTPAEQYAYMLGYGDNWAAEMDKSRPV